MDGTIVASLISVVAITVINIAGWAISAHRQSVEAAKHQGAFEERFRLVETGVTGMKEDMKGVKKDVSGLSRKVSNMSGRVTRMSRRVFSLEKVVINGNKLKDGDENARRM